MGLNAEKAQSFYYSAHHLARDLFWNAGNFAFFVLLAAAIDEKYIRAAIWSLIQGVAGLDSPVLEVAISLACLALGAVSGIIANQIFVALIALLPQSWVGRITYDGFYALDQERLRAVYDKIFEGNAALLLRPTYKEMDLIVRLTSLMRLYNPSGYAHLFRTYSVVSLFRQAIVYSFILGAWALRLHFWIVFAALVGAIVVLFLALYHAVADSGMRDYAFILATHQWFEQQRSLAVMSAEIANSGLKRTTSAAA